MTTTFDYKNDLLQDTVSVAPSPATTGLTLTPTTPSLFPDPAVVGAYDIWYTPSIAVPSSRSNTEKLRVTAKTGSVLTVSRHQGVTSAQSILAGGIIYLAPTTKHFTDIEAVVNSLETANTTTTSSLAYLYLNYFNVMKYGAIGDGVTNDYTAVQAAITACVAAGGGVVWFPTGTYLCNTGLVVPSTNSVILRGASWGSIITGTGNPIVTVTGSTSTNILCRIENIRVIATGTQVAIHRNGTFGSGGNSGLSLDNVYVLGTGTGAQTLLKYTGMQSTCVVKNSSFINSTGSNNCTGIWTDGATSSVMGLRIIECTIIAKTCINLTGSISSTVEGIVVHGCEMSGATVGITASHNTSVSISDTEFTAGATGIILAGNNNAVLINNCYFDLGVDANIIEVYSVAAISSQTIKIRGCYFQSGGHTGKGVYVNTNLNDISELDISNNAFLTLTTCIDASISNSNNLNIMTIVGNAFANSTVGIALGTHTNTGISIVGNSFAGNVTTTITGTRIGNNITGNAGDSGATQTYTPTITAGNSVAFTSVAGDGRWTMIDQKHMHLTIRVVITTNGGAGSYVIVPLPTGAVAANLLDAFILIGVTSAGAAIIGSVSAGASAINIQDYAGGYPGASGRTLYINGIVELA